MGTETAEGSQLLETSMLHWEARGSGLSAQEGPYHKGILLEVPVLVPNVKSMGDLEGFGVGK